MPLQIKLALAKRTTSGSSFELDVGFVDFHHGELRIMDQLKTELLAQTKQVANFWSFYF